MTHNYETAIAELHSHGKPVPRRKVANHTYLVRTGDDIAVRFHETDVVTYHANNTITLNSGGWLTKATNARIDEFTPAWIRVFSNRGRWMLALGRKDTDDGYSHPDWDNAVPFFDGMLLVPGDVVGSYKAAVVMDTTEQDRANAKLRKLMAAWSRKLVAGTLTETECAQCMGATDNRMAIGDDLGLTKHLLDHLINGTINDGLRTAVARRTAPHNWETWLRHGIMRPEHFRRYFTERLFTGAVAAKHGSYPADVLRNPSTYFGVPV